MACFCTGHCNCRCNGWRCWRCGCWIYNWSFHNCQPYIYPICPAPQPIRPRPQPWRRDLFYKNQIINKAAQAARMIK